MARDFEPIASGEIPNSEEGIPQDILTDPGKYEEQLPFLKRTIGFVRQYEQSRPKGKEALLDQLSSSIINDPKVLEYLFNNLDLLEQLRPELKTAFIQDELVQQVEKSLERGKGISRWDAGKIERLVQLGLDSSSKLTPAYQRMQKALFNSPKTVNDAVDLQYQSSWAMITTENDDIRREIISILCYERNTFQATSFAALLFFCGKYFGDDSHIERWFAVIDAINEVARLMEKPFRIEKSISNKIQRRFQQDHDAEFLLPSDEQQRRLKFVQEQVRKNPIRSRQLHDLSDDDSLPDQEEPGSLVWSFEGNFKQILDRKSKRDQHYQQLTWPENLIYNFNEPLKAYISKYYGPKIHKAIWEDRVYSYSKQGYERLTPETVQVTDDLDLDIIGKGYDTLEQKQKIVREIYSAIFGDEVDLLHSDALSKLRGSLDAARGFDGLMCLFIAGLDVKFALSHHLNVEEKGRLASILQYHRPIISIDQAWALSNQNSVVRQEIRTRFARGIGRRGFTTVVTDPALLQYGYKDMTFKKISAEGNIQVSINISGHNYEFDIDPDYRTVLSADVKKFESFQDQAWLEALVLAHLRKVICAEEEKMEAELIGGKVQHEIYKRQTLNRTEHLRKQNPGRNYTKEAYEKCLQSNLQVKDLHLINRLRASIGWGGTLDTGIWTYVSPVEKVESSLSKPVKIAFANATGDLRKVLNLGETSQEELLRIEDDILRELAT